MFFSIIVDTTSRDNVHLFWSDFLGFCFSAGFPETPLERLQKGLGSFATLYFSVSFFENSKR
jgi:hypothetical protein